MVMLITVNDITLRTGAHLSFAHTTWQIEKDQHWAILGPTGSGKSTLAKGLSRQIPLVQGQILFFFDNTPNDAVVAGRPYLHANEVLTFSAETHQAFFGQFVAYHQARWQSFEGEETPLVGSLLEGQAAHQPVESAPAVAAGTETEKMKHVINLLGIRPLLGRKVHQLSHGESRKIFLARLLLRSPRLLILDDPYTGLDAPSRARLKEGIESLRKYESPQILFLASRFEDIPAGIDRLLLVSQHTVLAQGDRQVLQNNPAYRAFFSAPGAARGGSTVSPALSGMIERYAEAMAADTSLRTGENAPEMISMRDVSIAYQGKPVLQSIDWTVRQGERWALLGTNGAGKSTLLSLILADNPQAYANDIRLFGKQRGSGESIWQIKQRIGWVAPELHVFYDRSTTTRDVVSSGFFDSVGLYRRCSPEQADVVSGWMEALDLTPLADRRLHTLSAGQQRLALLARALVKTPPLLVFDEPCQGLDDDHRFKIIDLVDQLCRAALVTIIYVSHYQDEIPAAITHRIYLNEGRIQSCGPVE